APPTTRAEDRRNLLRDLAGPVRHVRIAVAQHTRPGQYRGVVPPVVAEPLLGRVRDTAVQLDRYAEFGVVDVVVPALSPVLPPALGQTMGSFHRPQIAQFEHRMAAGGHVAEGLG